MSSAKLISLIVVAVAAMLLWMSVFIVNERQYAIKFRLGEIVRYDYKPGMHFMIPFINNVRKFDKRILTMDSKPQQFLTGEKKNVIVDFFVKWHISDVRDFYLAFKAGELDASDRLSEIVKNGLQLELDQRTIKEVVAGDRAQIMENMAKRANDQLSQFGVNIIDVRIKQIELPADVRDSVFDRMRAERTRTAKEFRAKGEKEANIIRAKADRTRTEILAKAQRKGEVLRGAGDAIATETYAKAYSKNKEFYEFYRSLTAYKNTFRDKNDVMVLEPDSEFFKYFGSAKGAN